MVNLLRKIKRRNIIHLSGLYIGPYCNTFNLKLEYKKGFNSDPTDEKRRRKHKKGNRPSSSTRYLTADGRDKFRHTARHYPDSDLVFAKVNYPYEYMDGRDTFLLTELPPIDAFYS